MWPVTIPYSIFVQKSNLAPLIHLVNEAANQTPMGETLLQLSKPGDGLEQGYSIGGPRSGHSRNQIWTEAKINILI